jgi:hypothetical protein
VLAEDDHKPPQKISDQVARDIGSTEQEIDLGYAVESSRSPPDPSLRHRQQHEFVA